MDVITDYGTFLREAKTAVLELRDMQQQEQQLLKRLKQDQKQLETDKKAVEERISQTTKKRLGEITASYDKELSKGQDQLKKVRSKREKAKNQGVKHRICGMTTGESAFRSRLFSSRTTCRGSAIRIFIIPCIFQDILERS